VTSVNKCCEKTEIGRLCPSGYCFLFPILPTHSRRVKQGIAAEDAGKRDFSLISVIYNTIPGK